MNNIEKIFNEIGKIFDINFCSIKDNSFSDNFFKDLIIYEYSIEKEFSLVKLKNLFILYYKILTFYNNENKKNFQSLETRFLILLNKKFIIEIIKEKKREKNSSNNKIINKNNNNKSFMKKISYIKNLHKIEINNENEKINFFDEANYIKNFNNNLNNEINKQKLNFKMKLGKKKKIYLKKKQIFNNNNNEINFNDENINILNIIKKYLKTPKKSSNKKFLITFHSNKNITNNFNLDYYSILNSENSFFNLITPTKCVSSFNLNTKKNNINIKNEQNIFKSKKIKNILNLTIENYISNINKNFYFNNFIKQIFKIENCFNQKYKEFININNHYIKLIKENQYYENNIKENFNEEKKDEIEKLNLKYEQKIKNILKNKNFKINNEIKIYIEQIKWEILLKINEIYF